MQSRRVSEHSARARLSQSELFRGDLSRGDLSRGDLSRADLSRGNLSRGNLSRASLPQADVSRIDTDVSAFLPSPRFERIGDYTVELGPKIGSGGYSTVYNVKDAHSHRNFALKIVEFGTQVAEDIRANLLDEVRTLRDLKGVPHVIQLLASVTSRDRVEMLMEFGQGDLEQILASSRDSGTAISIDFIRYWGGQMLQAVQQVHAHNIVHADLKPANFVIVSGSLKLIDFGIANPVPQHTTSVHRATAVGTLMYMAPETTKETGGPQAESRYRVTKASDVWSCGIILYEMVYERYPYDPRTYLYEAQLGELKEVRHSTHTRHGIPVPLALHEVIRDCLKLDPKERCSIEVAAKSLFFSPVSVDLPALMDIACVVRNHSLASLDPSVVAAATTAAELVQLDAADPKQERRRRRDLEKVVRGVYRNLVKVNNSNRYKN